MEDTYAYCRHGHLKSPENTNERNRCKICIHISNKKWRDKNRDKKNNDNREYYYANKERVTAIIEKSRLKRQYGITKEEYDIMAVNQNNVCAICGKQETEKYGKLAIDHDHKTGVIRSLLCHKCNRGLGSFNDDIQILQSALEYLNSHKQTEEIENAN